eukprot:6191085-Pleurochrysis_carterae.AAC.1
MLTSWSTDPNEPLLRDAPTVHELPSPYNPHERHPFLVTLPGKQAQVCATYALLCVPGAVPARAALFLASDAAVRSALSERSQTPHQICQILCFPALFSRGRYGRAYRTSKHPSKHILLMDRRGSMRSRFEGYVHLCART